MSESGGTSSFWFVKSRHLVKNRLQLIAIAVGNGNSIQFSPAIIANKTESYCFLFGVIYESVEIKINAVSRLRKPLRSSAIVIIVWDVDTRMRKLGFSILIFSRLEVCVCQSFLCFVMLNHWLLSSEQNLNLKLNCRTPCPPTKPQSMTFN